MDQMFQLMREVVENMRDPESSAVWRAFDEVYRSSEGGQARELACNVLRHHQVLICEPSVGLFIRVGGLLIMYFSILYSSSNERERERFALWACTIGGVSVRCAYTQGAAAVAVERRGVQSASGPRAATGG